MTENWLPRSVESADLAQQHEEELVVCCGGRDARAQRARARGAARVSRPRLLLLRALRHAASAPAGFRGLASEKRWHFNARLRVPA